jgi:hypothetical protein
MKHLLGLDHVVIMVRSLDAAGDTWRQLGFTLSPRGTHSAHMGTGNHTIMLDPDYFELLGVVTPTPHNAGMRESLTRREGLGSAAMRTDDAAAGVAELGAHGIAAAGPLDFGRPVAMPDGSATEARFRVFQWPASEAPAGLHLFACQHVTPQAVWIPALQSHANTARRIRAVEVLARDPRGAAAHLARLIDATVEEAADGTCVVPTGPGRAQVVFLDGAALGRRHPGVPLAGLPDEGGVGLVIEVTDLDSAAACVATRGVRSSTSVTVGPGVATGMILRFIS